ncbi:MAG: Holliday junction resolvase RuvX [Acidobacteria bacterium]|nr:MAG: Holliday junction resolvase RuvX [Acidobacteriota bacterium]
MGRILGVDVGTRTLGLALSDEGGTVAMPLSVIRRSGLRRDIADLARLVREREVTEIVVGLPLGLDGAPGAMAEEARVVADRLAEATGLPVHRWDERLSTVAAERALLEADLSRRKRKRVVDKVAAALILQAFLDRRALGRAP